MKAVAHLRDRFGVDPILRVLGVAPSTFDGWPAALKPLPRRPPSLTGFADSDSASVVGTRRFAW